MSVEFCQSSSEEFPSSSASARRTSHWFTLKMEGGSGRLKQGKREGGRREGEGKEGEGKEGERGGRGGLGLGKEVGVQ